MNRHLCALLFAGVTASIGFVGQEPTSSQYFPPRTFGDIEGRFYAAALQQMGEAPLAPTQSREREVYRFLWAPSFHALAVVRLERDGDRITVSATRVQRGAGGNRWGKVEPRIQKTLTPAEWSLLSEQLSAARFWFMTPKEPEKRDAAGHQIIGLDGDTWILEAADARRHHVVARWYHEEYPAFESACYCMLEWSGLRQALMDIEQYGHGVRDRLTTRCTRRP